MRVQLSNEVADVINDFGPKLYEDFSEVCISFSQPKISFSSTYSGVFWFLLPVCLLQAELLDCGAERAAQGQWMHKA